MTAEELRQRFAWMAKLEDDADVTAIPLTEPGTMLTDGDHYVDATSPKRGRVAVDGGRARARGRRLHRARARPTQALWERIGAAIR